MAGFRCRVDIVSRVNKCYFSESIEIESFIEKERGDKVCARSVSCFCVTNPICASRSVAVVQRQCVLYFEVSEFCARHGPLT